MSDVRVAIVGAYGGIGQSLCREVLEQGGQARLIGRDVVKLEGASSEFGFAHFVADATDWDQLDRAIELAQQSMRGLKIGRAHV